VSEDTQDEAEAQDEGQRDEGQQDEGQRDEGQQDEGQRDEGQQDEGRDEAQGDEGGNGDEGGKADEGGKGDEGDREEERTSHPHGTPAWADLGTSDAEAAVSFYAGLFGWEAENTPAGPAGTYVLLRSDGKDVAALYEQDEAMRSRGVPPLWLVYVAVDDVSAAAVSVQEAGGTVHAQPFDVGDAGRMALVQDPAGAMFGLWQAGRRRGAEVLGEVGAMDWFELSTTDPEGVGSFYEQVFGWEVSADEVEGTSYTTCSLDGRPVAGILPAEALPEGVAPSWTVYFRVEDCTAVVEQATSAGGELLSGPHDMPSVGRFAGLRDPQGAAFAVLQQEATDEQEQARQEDEQSDDERSEERSEGGDSEGGEGQRRDSGDEGGSDEGGSDEGASANENAGEDPKDADPEQ
jgi:predicted enzyme related to lactoylglutathione lyase